MKQSRLGSFAESCINTAAGFGLSLLLQWAVLGWLMGASIPLTVNLAFAAVMTAASLARQYVLRRVFEFFRISRKLSAAMTAVIAERFGQVEREGWTAEHDDAHDTGVLARAGAAYAAHPSGTPDGGPPGWWPWDAEWWKPADYRRSLVKAAALIIAEIERFDRKRMRKPRGIVKTRERDLEAQRRNVS